MNTNEIGAVKNEIWNRNKILLHVSQENSLVMGKEISVEMPWSHLKYLHLDLRDSRETHNIILI